MTGDARLKPRKAYLNRETSPGQVTVLAVSGLWAMVRFPQAIPTVVRAADLVYAPERAA